MFRVDSVNAAGDGDGYRFPADPVLNPDEERTLAVAIQAGIDCLANRFVPRLVALIADGESEGEARDRMLAQATAIVRTAVVAHCVDSPGNVDGFEERVVTQLRSGLKCALPQRFALVDGDADALLSGFAEMVEPVNRFVRSNMRLVHTVAKRYRDRFLTARDLDQEGAFAIRKAVLLFRPDAGTRFSSYAVPAIRSHLLDVLRSAHGTSDYAERLVEEFLYAKEQVAHELRRMPSNGEVFDFLGWGGERRETVERALRVSRPGQIASQQGGGHDEAFKDPNPRPDEELQEFEEERIHREQKTRLVAAINGLSPEERQFIVQYYYEGMSLREIAAQQGNSDHHVRMLRSRAEESLRHETGSAPMSIVSQRSS